MNYYRLEMWFDFNEKPAKSGRRKLHWGLAMGSAPDGGTYTAQLKSVINGKKHITITGEATSQITFNVFDVTSGGTGTSISAVLLNFTQSGAPANVIPDAADFRRGIQGTMFMKAQANNPWGTTIYSNGGTVAPQGWYYASGFEGFTAAPGTYHFTGTVQAIQANANAPVDFVFDPEMDINM